MKLGWIKSRVSLKMKNILTFSVIFILFGYINCNCLLRDVSHKCLINENLADEKWLQDICVNNKSVISKLSIVGVLKNELKSYRTFDDYCKIGAIGRFSWINYTKIIEPLLNSAGVDMVNLFVFFFINNFCV